MIAKAFAENGAHVFIGGRRKHVVDQAAVEFGKSITPLELDVASKESILGAVKVIETAHGKLDVLINNAGQIGPMSMFLNDPDAPERVSADAFGKGLFNNESFEQWANLFNINISSIHFVTAAFLGLLAKASEVDEDWSASIINITSISGHAKVAQCHFAYNASKAAADHLTRIMATELALKNVKVRVNAIAPGLFPSEMTGKKGDDDAFGEDVTSFSGAIYPVPSGRSGRPEEIAGPAIFLASKSGRYTNGQIIVVDGSWEAVNPAAH